MKKNGILFALLIVAGSLWAQTSTNIAPSAEITTTVTQYYTNPSSGATGDSATNIGLLTDGVKDSSSNAHLFLAEPNADGKKITFTWSSGSYNHGKFILYNRDHWKWGKRIDTSTVAFFHGENRVYLDTILSAGTTVTITAPADSTFNKVVLTFSGNAQNFREIEIFGKPSNLVPRAEITTTVFGTWDGFGVQAHINRIKDGNKDTSAPMADLAEADGTNITFAWPGGLYTQGRFVLYNRDIYQYRIDSSTVAFFRGETKVHLDTILNAGDTVIITAPVDSTFNKVVLTFSWVNQNFKEIEIYGIPTPSIYDSVSIQGPDTVFVGGTSPLTATVHGIHADQTVKWSSSNTSVATVDSTGVVTSKTVGTATITATSTADISKFATKTITVPTPVVDRVRIAGDYSIWVGYTSRFSATVFGTIIDRTVKWSSSDTAVATVDSTGVVTAVTVGEVSIKATSQFDNTQKDSTTIAIIPVQTNNLASSADVTTTFAIVWPSDSAQKHIVKLRDGVKNSDLDADVFKPQYAHGKNISFVWPSNLYHIGRFVLYNNQAYWDGNEYVACCKDRIVGSTVEFFNGDSSVHLDTISDNGEVITILPDSTVEFNKVVLTFPSSGDGFQNIREIEIFGTPTPTVVDSIRITGDNSILVGSTAQFSATVTGINADTTVTWSSSDASKATVDSNGVVTGKATGTVDIIATSIADTTKTATKTISIRPGATNVARSASVTTTVPSVWGGGTVQDHIDRITDGNKALSAPIADLSGATGKNITFGWPGKLYYHGTFIFYNRTSHQTRIVGSTVQFFNGDSVTHESTISSGGDAITIAPNFSVEFNKVVLTFPFTGDGAQNFREIEIFGTPTPSVYDSVSITGGDSVFVGGTTALTATVFGVNADSTVKWSSSDVSVATVDSNGVVMGKTGGTATIIATSTADTSKFATKTITVPTPVVDSVRIAGDGSIWVGDTSRFSATVFARGADSTVTWSSSDEAVATVSSTGAVTAVAVGEVSIKATSTVDDTKTASITIAIVEAQTNIAPHADITTTVTQYYSGDSASNIGRIIDGEKLTFAWPDTTPL